MTVELEQWVKRATRQLSGDARAQVRSEIGEHYEAARESAVERGSRSEEAERLALAALGDAGAANREYRKVMLTSGEARLLREGNWEASAICSHRWLKWMLVLAPAGAAVAGIVMLLNGATGAARVLLVGGVGMGIVFGATLLPVYTLKRGRIYRAVKWMVMAGVLVVAFWPAILQWSWLLFSCVWPMVWAERRRASIRRKLPVARWPKQLYL